MSIDTIEATWKVGRPKWNGVIEREPRGIAHARPVDHPGHEQRGDRAEHESEQDRDPLQGGRREALDQDDQQQRPEREARR